MAVVKANGYGHGLDVVSRTMADHVDWFGVDSLIEAEIVQQVAPQKPILIMGHSQISEASTIVADGFRPVTYRIDLAKALSEAAVKLKKQVKLHLKVETGTNRQGVHFSEVASFGEMVSELPGIEIEGISTHFANIEDTADPSFALLQLKRFNEAIEKLAIVGIHPAEVHAAATASILLYPQTHFTMVRLGIGGYGIWPSRQTREAAQERGIQASLEPALSWKAEIAQLKTIKAGEHVGYGLSFQAKRQTILAVVPVGYYEGYDRRLSNSGTALVAGEIVPVVGRVAMNMIMLDVTDTKPSIGDEVILIGSQDDANITVEGVADAIGTIPYEVLARLNPLLKRKVI